MEFTFTTLVTFGGAFFASFPLFYSTSFGGAFYVWMAILLVFVIQAVAYEYRRKPGNVFGEKTFNVFLMINGIAGPLLLGTAVGTLFTGANFTVDRLNLANGAGSGSATVISQWTTPWHGLEALTDVSNVFLGIAVTFLAATLACQYFMNNIDDKTILERTRRRMIPAAVCFVFFFVACSACCSSPTAGRSMPQAGSPSSRTSTCITSSRCLTSPWCCSSRGGGTVEHWTGLARPGATPSGSAVRVRY